MNKCPYCKSPATDSKRFLCGSRVKVTGTFDRRCSPTGTQADLQRQLAEAQAEIDNLRSMIGEDRWWMPVSEHDKSLAEAKRHYSEQLRLANIEADSLRAVIESQGRDHTQPCSLGELCPWCYAEMLKRERDSLRAVVAQAQVAMASCDDSGYWDGYKKIRTILASQPKVLAVVDGRVPYSEIGFTRHHTLDIYSDAFGGDGWDKVTAIVIERKAGDE